MNLTTRRNYSSKRGETPAITLSRTREDLSQPHFPTNSEAGPEERTIES